MNICESNTHPESTVVHIADECPACRIHRGVADPGRLRMIAGRLLALAELIDEAVGDPRHPFRFDEQASDAEVVAVRPDLGDVHQPTVVEVEQARRDEEPIVVPSWAAPVEAPPAVVEPTEPPPPTSKLKADAHRFEQHIDADTVTGIRMSDNRFPSPGVNVIAWRGRTKAASDYLAAIRVALDAQRPRETEEETAEEEPFGMMVEEDPADALLGAPDYVDAMMAEGVDPLVGMEVIPPDISTIMPSAVDDDDAPF